MAQLEKPRKATVGYLGPAGTFTEQAIYSQPDLASMNHRPINSIIDVLQAVESREVDLGLVAIENMIEGSVTATLDHVPPPGGETALTGPIGPTLR